MATRRMPQLSRGNYMVVKRILDNVWYGGVAPLQQALDYAKYEQNACVSDEEAVAALIEYIGMLIDVLPDGKEFLDRPDFDDRRRQYIRLCERLLTADIDYVERLKPLAVDATRKRDDLRLEHALAQNEASRLRRRNTALRSEMKTFESKNAALEQRIAAANKKMLALTRHLDSLLGKTSERELTHDRTESVADG